MKTQPIFHLLPRHVGQTLAAVLRDCYMTTLQAQSDSSQHFDPHHVTLNITSAKQIFPQDSVSWETVRQWIHSRRVLVNGNPCMDDARRMKLTDVIRLLSIPAPAPPTANDLRILYLDEAIVVVDKPPGITSSRHHEDIDISDKRRQLQPTLDELLSMAIANKSFRTSNSTKVHRPSVLAVHRIDRDTSGILVFARTKLAEQGLIPQFKKHTTKRQYLAICTGVFPERTAIYESRLVRDRGDGVRGSTSDIDLTIGKRAVTHVERMDVLNGYSLIQCTLETGRTHQIRIHLLEAGFPLVGDRMYRKIFRGRTIPDYSDAPRTMLHAMTLEFIHPIGGQRMRFQSIPPQDFLDCLQRLAKNA